MTDCERCPLRGRGVFTDITKEQLDFLSRFKAGELKVDAGTVILLEGSQSPQLYTVLQGWGIRTKLLPDGRRQVINFVLPGDFIGLQGELLGDMQHSVEASTAMTLCVFARERYHELYRTQPDLSYDVTWLSAREEHFLGDALTAVGQRTGIERIAWGLISLFRRAEPLGLTRGNVLPLPYRQQDLADAIGLSLVHTNKTLRSLRERQIVAWQEGALTIYDADRLQDIAQYDGPAGRRRPLI